MDLSSEDYIHEKLIRSRGKCAIYSGQKDFYVDVKQRKNNAGNQTMEQVNNNYTTISEDIWYHISNHIEPEDVQRFALICKQTASLVNSRRFWRNIYKRYCHSFNAIEWNLKLPNNLQVDAVNKCDMKLLRSLVIEALYYCHRTLNERINEGYSLEWLWQRLYVTSWQEKQENCAWIMCYKFLNQLPNSADNNSEQLKEDEVIDNWEALALNVHENNWQKRDSLVSKFKNPFEGMSILVICCGNFVPIPTQLSYNNQNSRYRLKSTRKLLSKDMRGTNLELNFADSCDNVTITVKYPQIQFYKVLPWWHPNFKTFIK